MSFLKSLLKLMPSSLVKSKGSNNWKLAKFYTSRLDEINETLNNIEFYRNIENAKGKVLDDLGDKYDVNRGPADDDFYRMMIRSKIANRKGDTTVNGILRTMQNSLNIDVKGVKLGPVYQKDGNKEPMALRLTNVPLRFARSEYEQGFMLKQIESIIAAGVRLQDLQFIVPLNAHWEIGGGLAYVESFTVDDSKDYKFDDNRTHFEVGATISYTSVSTTDDSKQYDNSISGSLMVKAAMDNTASVELTDQFDKKFEIGGDALMSSEIVHHEEYDIK